MFENKCIEGIYYSRFIASWYNSGGGKRGFKLWLGQLTINGRKLTTEEIREIEEFRCNGKLELEENAKNFIKVREDLLTTAKTIVKNVCKI